MELEDGLTPDPSPKGEGSSKQPFNFSTLQFFNSPVSTTNVFYLLLSPSTFFYLLEFIEFIS